MKFASRQKDKAINLDMKKDECNPITLEKRISLPHLGVANNQIGLTALMDLWVATNPDVSGCHSLIAHQHTCGSVQDPEATKDQLDYPVSMKSLKK